MDIGASTGIIDNYLSGYFKQVVGIDIDLQAVSHANKSYGNKNISFLVGDAMALPLGNGSFDVVICSQVYEHVPDAQKMISEIYRLLKPVGVCFFSAGNRINLIEPHYNLPLLSVVPKPLAHLYLKIIGKGDHYYEEHLTYWGLKELTRSFNCHDYTQKMLYDPLLYKVDYMLPPGSVKTRIAKIVANYFYWAFPNYIWTLQKPGIATPSDQNI